MMASSSCRVETVRWGRETRPESPQPDSPGPITQKESKRLGYICIDIGAGNLGVDPGNVLFIDTRGGIDLRGSRAEMA
jgi:hypothetical protein